MGKKCISLCVLFVLFGIFCQYSTNSTNINIVFCDVGQGDGILIWKGHTQIIIDGGKDVSFLECIGKYMPFFDRTIELVIATHPDIDHIGGLVEVLNRYKVDQIISSLSEKRDAFNVLYRMNIEKNINRFVYLQQNETIHIDDFEFTMLWPKKVTRDEDNVSNNDKVNILEENALYSEEKYRNTNSGSLVFGLKIGRFSALFTGDLEKEQEKMLITSGLLRKIDILKVGHHGSSSSTSSEFIKVLAPSYAVISVGRDNMYGHPTNETLKVLEENHVKVLRTDLLGDVRIKVSEAGVYKLDH